MITWFTRNGVAANLLMFIIVVGGLISLAVVKLELFPPISLDTVQVRVPYPGAAPEEVEEGIILRIEEEIQDIEGIKKITSSATENFGNVNVEVERGYDTREILDEVKIRVDAIDTFPEQAEEPIVKELLAKQDVLAIAITGDTDESTLKELAERVRDDLTAIEGISQVTVGGVREYEISIAVPEYNLRRYNLTFDEVAAAVRQNSLDLPGGTVRTEGGEILLRTQGQAYTGEEFRRLVLRTEPDGTRILLGDVADVVDGFVDQPLMTRFNGEPASIVTVFAVGDQSPLDVSRKVNAYVERSAALFPPEITLKSWRDVSFYLEGRLQLMINNGAIGLLLVLIVLTLFLRPSLAFFVSLGIPVSFLGTLAIMPFFDVSVNMISLFGFILVLGIVVDDAIVVGESVFTEFQHNGPGVASAIAGSERVAVPVVFAVLTTVVAFIPIFFISGFMGKLMLYIPAVVIPTLMWSLVQSKLVLPYHLSLCRVNAHNGPDREPARRNILARVQLKFANGLETFIKRQYRPFLHKALRARYMTLAIFVGALLITVALVAGNWVRFVFFPGVPSDYIVATLVMPEGTPFSTTREAVERMDRALQDLKQDVQREGGGDPFLHEFISIGQSQFLGGGPAGAQSSTAASNIGEIVLELRKSETRQISATRLSSMWRERIGVIPGARELSFQDEAASAGGAPVDIQLAGPNFETLQNIAEQLKDRLRGYDGLFDIRDSYASGKEEVELRILPSAEIAGLTLADLARQVRQAFYGEEAQRVQRGRNDVKVMVRYPDAERRTLETLEDMRIRTPSGLRVPFSEVAHADYGQGFSTIRRVDRHRVINVRADAEKKTTDVNAILKEITETELPSILADHPGVSFSLEGESREQAESFSSLLRGFAFVLFAIYCMMAVPFKSYLQPLIVMIVIPFGLVGAVLGHLLVGKTLSLLSVLGMVALAGVVINDSLVLVDYINRRRREGMSLKEAVRESGAARFRPILLTSLTTFAGLTPILLEGSLQAQFLIPMATSLAFGVLFGTLITLVLVPALYIILEDIKHLFIRAWHIGRGHG